MYKRQELDSGILYGRTSRTAGSPGLSDRTMPSTPGKEPMAVDTPPKATGTPGLDGSPVDSSSQSPAEQAPVEQESLQHEQPEEDENAAFWAKATALGIKPEQV